MPTESLVPVADEDVAAETDVAAAQDHAFADALPVRASVASTKLSMRYPGATSA